MNQIRQTRTARGGPGWGFLRATALTSAALFSGGVATLKAAPGDLIDRLFPEFSPGFAYEAPVDIDGDTAVVGDPSGEYGPPAVYVYTRGTTGWDLEDILSPFVRGVDPILSGGPVGFGDFGTAVSIDGDRIAVGAPYSGDGFGTYTAFVYARDDEGDWDLEGTLESPGGEGSEYFGMSIAVEGDTVVVGDPYSVPGRPDQGGDVQSGLGLFGEGQVFVYEFASEFGWEFDDQVSNPDPSSECFGYSLDFDGAKLVASAYRYGGPPIFNLDPGDDPFASGFDVDEEGIAIIFARDSEGEFIEEDTLSEGRLGFAASLALDGNTIAVGSPGFPGDIIAVTGDDPFLNGPGGPAEPGEVFIYTFTDGWDLDDVLTARTMFEYIVAPAGRIEPDGGFFSFGASVALDGEILVAGAPFDRYFGIDGPDGFVPPSAFVFENTEGGWMPQGEPLTGLSPFENFGQSVALDGGIALIGAPMDGGGLIIFPGDGAAGFDPDERSGSAYLFEVIDGAGGLFGPWEIEVAVLEGDPAGGESEFRSFSRAFVNNQDEIVVLAVTDSGTTGIFSDAGDIGTFSPVVEAGDDVPGDELSFTGFDLNGIALDESGETSFLGLAGGTRIDVFEDAVTAQSGAGADGGGDFQVLFSPVVGDNTQFAPALLRRGVDGILTTSDTGIWSDVGLLFREGDPSPEIGGGTLGQISPRVVAATEEGGIAFTSQIRGVGGADSAVYVAFDEEDATVVARKRDVAPGTGGALFLAFQSEAISAFGFVGFRATIFGPGVSSVNNEGIWAEGIEGLELIAREGDEAPGTGGAEFGRFGEIYALDGGGMVFTNFLKGDGVASANDGSLWVRFPFSPPLLIAREGDEAAGIEGGLIGQIVNVTGSSSGGVGFVGRLVNGLGGVTSGDNLGLWLQRGFRGGIIGDGFPGGGGPIFEEPGLDLAMRKGMELELEPGEEDPRLRTVLNISLDLSTNPQGGSGGGGRTFNDFDLAAVRVSLSQGDSGVFALFPRDTFDGPIFDGPIFDN